MAVSTTKHKNFTVIIDKIDIKIATLIDILLSRKKDFRELVDVNAVVSNRSRHIP